MKKKIKETASAGSISSSSIANSYGGSRSDDSTESMTQFFAKYLKKTKGNTFQYKVIDMKPFKFGKINESDATLNSIFSNLKNSEKQSYEKQKTVTYGVEDDNGNLMKITIPRDQSEDFEVRLSKELAEIEDFKSSGHKGKNISMAELLYDLKDDYEILDVEFPTIPSDVVYNAEMASEDVGDDMGDDMGDEFDNDMGDDMEGMGDDMGELDDESVEDFEEDEVGNDEGSMLSSIMDMLKKQADAEKAKADAEAEKARAKQAEYSAASARMEMEKQEDVVRIESEMDEQKQKEKEAKKMAEIAKHKYSQSKSFNEGFNFSEMMIDVIVEFDELETPEMLQKQKRLLKQKFQSSPTDTPEQKKYKQERYRYALVELNAKIRGAKSAESHNAREANKNKQDQSDDGDALNFEG